MRQPSAIPLLLLVLAGGGRPGPATESPVPPDGPLIRLRAAPVREDLAGRMRVWSAAFRRQMQPVLRDWQRVAAAARPGPSETLVAGCRRLERSLDRLDRQPLLAPPDRAVALHLGRVLATLTDAAASCTHGAYFLTTWRLDRAAAAWDELERRLETYAPNP